MIPNIHLFIPFALTVALEERDFGLGNKVELTESAPAQIYPSFSFLHGQIGQCEHQMIVSCPRYMYSFIFAMT